MERRRRRRGGGAKGGGRGAVGACCAVYGTRTAATSGSATRRGACRASPDHCKRRSRPDPPSALPEGGGDVSPRRRHSTPHRRHRARLSACAFSRRIARARSLRSLLRLPPPPRPDTRARTHSARQIKTSGRLTAKVRSRARPREHAPTRICALVRGDAVCVTRVRGVVRRPTQGPPWPAVAPCSGSIGCHRGSELLTRGAARAGRGLCAPAGAGPAGDRPGRGPPPALRVSALSAEFRVLRRQAPPSMALAVQARSTGRPGSALWLEFEGDKCD